MTTAGADLKPISDNLVACSARTISVTIGPDIQYMDPEVEPESVRVMGPARLVQGIDTLYTVAVDITGERERIQRQVALALPANVANLETRRCVVTIRLARAEPDSMSGRARIR